MILTHDDWERPIESVVDSVKDFVDEVLIFDDSKLFDAQKASAIHNRASIVHCGPFHGVQDGETEKWQFATSYGKSSGWAFYLASDELLMAGGEHIRKAASYNPAARRFKVTMLESGGKTGFRENMFACGTFGYSGAVDVLPVVIRHLRLPSKWRSD